MMFKFFKRRKARHKALIIQTMNEDVWFVARIVAHTGLATSRVWMLLHEMEFHDGTVISGWKHDDFSWPRRRVYWVNQNKVGTDD